MPARSASVSGRTDADRADAAAAHDHRALGVGGFASRAGEARGPRVAIGARVQQTKGCASLVKLEAEG